MPPPASWTSWRTSMTFEPRGRFARIQRIPGPRLSTIDVKPSSQWPRALRVTTSSDGGRCTRFGNFGVPTGTTRQSSAAPEPRSRGSVPSAATDCRWPRPSSNAMRVPAGDQTGRCAVPGCVIGVCVVPSSTTIVDVPSAATLV